MTTDTSEIECGRLRSRRWLLARGAAAMSAFVVTSGLAAEHAGSVEDVKGEAFAEAATVQRVLGFAAPVFLGDNVGTGVASRLGMRLGRDTTIRLGEKARLKIDRFLVDAGGVMTLQSGAVLFDRPPGARPAPVRIRSPFALIAVRGTRFFAGPSNGRFGVLVERGAVSVTAAGRRVVLHDGEGTDFSSPGTGPRPVMRWRQQRIDAALASVS